jgi:hypothetical protein
MNWKPILISIAFVAINQISFAQYCGTTPSAIQLSIDTAIVPQAKPYESLPQVNRNLSIALYIVKDTLGISKITSTDIDAAIATLNGYFSPIALKFHVCKTTYIDNYQFDNLYAGKNETDLTNSYFLTNVINIYVVNGLSNTKNTAITGFTYMPADKKDFVFISKTSFNGSEIGHQMGHFFNLYHTHEVLKNNELEYVDRSNCTTAGDKCCDTEADPNLTDLMDDNCLYTGKLKDPNPTNSQYYKPLVKNLMSLSKDDCRCSFSPTQYLRIVYALKNLKSNLQ